MENVLKKILKSVKLKDAGVKREYEDLPVIKKDKKDKKYYPKTYFTTKQIPGLDGMEVEDECMLILRCKICGHSLNEYAGNKNEEYQVEIKSAAVVNDRK